jgi:hypothetical protein
MTGLDQTPTAYFLEYEDSEALAEYRAKYGDEAARFADGRQFWKIKDFDREGDARAFVAAKRESIGIGYAALFKRANMHDDGFTESWGNYTKWIPRWEWDDEFVTDEL